MLERCISLEPRFVQAYLELLLLKPEDEKKGVLDKLLELEPRNWEHYLLYGNWYKDRGMGFSHLINDVIYLIHLHGKYTN